MSKNKSRMRRKGRRKPDHAPWHTVWPSLSAWKQHLLVLLFLIVVSVGFFAPLHFSEKSLIGGDTVNWMSMAHSMIEYEESTGDVALWAGNAFAGMPGYMISPELSIPQIDSLFRFLRGFLWPTSHFLLLLVGTYLLGWFLTSDKLAGLFASVAYGLTTYIPVILVAGHNSKFIALAWAPWLLLAFLYVLRKPTLHGALLFAVALASNLRAGHVQITYYVTFAAVVWFIVRGVQAARDGGLKTFGASFLWLASGSVLGLMMVAEPYLAHAEYAAHTIRGASAGGEASGLDWSYAMGWSQGKAELLTLMIADAFGGAGGTYWGPKAFTSGPHYVGGLVAALSGLALWSKRDAATIALGVSVLFTVVFSLGENAEIINRLAFDYLPMFSSFRVPETWLSITALLLALLSAKGLSTIRKRRQDVTAPLTRDPAVRALAAAAIFVLGIYVFRGLFLDFEKEFESQRILQQIQRQYPNINPSDQQVTQAIRQEMARRHDARVDAFTSDAQRTMLVLITGIGLIALYRRRKIPFWALSIGLVFVLTMDLGSVDRRYLNESVLTVADSAEEEVPTFDFDRYILERVDEAGGPGRFRVLSLEFNQDPSVNARPSYHYESLGGYSGAKLRVYQDFLDHVLFSSDSGGLNPNALDMMNVRYLVAARGLPGYELVYRDDQAGVSVYRNPGDEGRAYFVDRAEVLPDAVAVWERLGGQHFDPGRTVLFMEKNAPDLSSMPGRDSTPEEEAADDSTQTADGAAVLTETYTPQNMTFEVRTDRERWLVVSEVYYPEGWKAFVDGEETEIEQADYLLRGIRVPAGDHEVRLVFEPASYRIGRLVTGSATVFTYGLLLLLAGMTVKRETG